MSEEAENRSEEVYGHSHDNNLVLSAREKYYSNNWPELTDNAISNCRENGLGHLLRNVESNGGDTCWG